MRGRQATGVHLGNPHDALFRFVLADASHAEGLLRRMLPRELHRALAHRPIRAVPASAVGPRLRRHHADLLFVAQHPELGQPILLLLEHKSGREHRLTRQLVRYLVNLGPTWAKGRGLPPFLVSFVVHHGRRPIGPMTWRPSLRKAPRAEGLFEGLRALDPTLRILAWDLTDCSQAEVMTAEMTALARLCLLFLQFLPGSTEATCVENLDRWAELLREAAEAPAGHESIDRLHSYILHVTNVSPERLATVFARILHRSHENPMITTAQRIRAAAIAEGKAEGITEGRAEGKAEGKAELLLRLLAAKFGDVADSVTKRVQAATASELDEYGLRLLNASTIAEVLRDE